MNYWSRNVSETNFRNELSMDGLNFLISHGLDWFLMILPKARPCSAQRTCKDSTDLSLDAKR